MPVFRIGGDAAPVQSTAQEIGGKAMSLVEMTKMGLPVPPAIVIPCLTTFLYKDDPAGTIKMLRPVVRGGLEWIEEQVGRACLFSVRSGAPVSMPGMMDTILNVGLNGKNQNEFTFMSDKTITNCHGRLAEMFKIAEPFASKIPVGQMAVLDQVMACVEAVFHSWDSERAVEYRKLHNIPNSLGTAVTIQAMVYGNLNEKSGSGVLFTRNPSTGENKIMCEYLANAQGEDVVAGTHTPIKLQVDGGYVPGCWQHELDNACQALEAHYHDMVDVEFTVEDDKLYILQSRKGKRTPKAAVKIATDLLREGIASPDGLKDYLTVKQVCEATQSVIVSFTGALVAGTGLPAGGGVVRGKAVMTIEDAMDQSKAGPVVLVREETLPDDIKGMHAAVGIVTYKGGATSHAAVVSRSMGKACVVGLQSTAQIKAGDWVVVDGETGNVWIDNAGTMKIEVGSESMIEELAAEIANKQGLQLVTTRVELVDRPVVRIADMLFDNTEVQIKKPKGMVVVDASHVDTFMHNDDKAIWDMLAPLTEKEIDTTFQDVISGLNEAGVDSIVLSAPKGYEGKKVSAAKTIEDAFSGEHCMIDIGFQKRVVGSKAMWNKLVAAFGEPKKFGSTATVYEVVMGALA